LIIKKYFNKIKMLATRGQVLQRIRYIGKRLSIIMGDKYELPESQAIIDQCIIKVRAGEFKNSKAAIQYCLRELKWKEPTKATGCLTRWFCCRYK
jgi:hypothetical protein